MLDVPGVVLPAQAPVAEDLRSICGRGVVMRREAPRELPHLLLALLAFAALAAPGSAQSECEANPTLDACRSYTVAEEVLQRDLGRICAGAQLGGATYSGWPAACTLWHECQQGRAAAASCGPLALLQTACNETPELEACMP